MGLFPYSFRPFQAEAVERVRATAQAGGHLVLEAPTGTGKTVVLLTGALEATLEAGRRVLYVTRTNSQQEQALRELGRVAARAPRPVRAFALQGRQRLCLKLQDAQDPEWADASPEELGHFCRHAKRVAEEEPESPKACPYFARLRQLTDDDVLEKLGPGPVTAEAFQALGRSHGFCSYEATKRLLGGADVLVAPYAFAFDPGLRRRLFEWWGTRPDQVVLMVDEAHNLPEYVRRLHSPRLGLEAIRRARAEAEALGRPDLARGIDATALIEALQEAVERIASEYAPEDDGFIPPFELEAALLGRFRTTTSGLVAALAALAQLGEIVKDRRRLEGKIPRSALSLVASFLAAWISADDERAVKLALRTPHPTVELFCVDAAAVATGLQDFHATIHASGTLAPLAEYRDTLGLGSEARLERFPSPFAPERLRLVAARGLTTRYETLRSDPGLVDRLQETTRRFLASSHVSTAVYFPSHQLLRDFLEVGALPADHPQLLVENAALSQERLMQLVQLHRAAPGRSVLAAVLGGRLSEGLDFPGRQLEAVLVVGAPFPKPTARQRALFRLHESRHGCGWDYAVRAPTVRLLRQALGRLIRGPQDRGFAAILDERAHRLLEDVGVACPLVAPDELVAAYAAWQADSEDDMVKSAPPV